MKSFRLVFFITFFLYHLAVMIMVIIININAEDIGFLLKLHDRISLLFYGASIGLVLYFVNVGLVYLQDLRYGKIIEMKEKNITELKAKLYDQLIEEQDASNNTAVDSKDKKEE
jgi:hypothetical protein